MCDDALAYLDRAQVTLSQHLAKSDPVTDEQLTLLNRKVGALRDQVEEIHQHQLSFHHGAVENTKQWTALADRGKLVDAIKGARVAHGLGIYDAKQLVTAYNQRKYAFAGIPPHQA